jgi:predicted permease
MESSLEDEIRDHLERRAAMLRETGMDPGEAEHQARVAFGSIRRVREESREIRTWTAFETTLRDIRYAWRGLLRNRTFSVTAVASLSIAIGAITAVYSVADAAMFRALPVRQPDQLFTLSVPGRNTFSYPAYLQVRQVTDGGTRVALISVADRVETQTPDRSAPFETVVQQYVSGTAFDAIGVRPALGRLLSEADDRGPRTERVAVLSFDYWRRRFGSDPGVLNRLVVINGGSYRIVGVAARGFFGVEPGKLVDLWLPIMTFDPGVFTNPAASLFRIVGRLPAGASRQQLEIRLQTVVPEIRIVDGASGLASFRSAFGPQLAIIGVVAALILLIAVANVASLLMGSATVRSGEMALRMSLGATRARIVRQLLIESALLSSLAGVCGWLIAMAGTPRLIAALSTERDPVQLVSSMNSRVLWFCIAICVACAVLFGLVPAWTAASAPMHHLKRVGRQASPSRVRSAVVATQMAVAFCLVFVAFSFLYSVDNLLSVNPGFQTKHVAVLTLHSDLGPNQDGLRMTQELQRGVDALPGVEGAAVAWYAIFNGSRRLDGVVVPGEPRLERQDIFYRVSPGYFATLKTPLLDGRDLTPNDSDAHDPIATVVNLAFVHTYFDDGHALGRVFQRSDGARHVVVGIAADSVYDDLRRGPQPIAYFPMKPPRIFSMYVRSALDDATVMRLVAREAATTTPGIRVVDVTTLDALIGNTLVTEKLLASLGSLFAAIGLALAAIGVFGVVNYTVLRQTREMGIRVALGAPGRALVALVVKDFLWILTASLAAGFVAAVTVTLFVRSHLFGVHLADPRVTIGAVAVCVAATGVALIVPVLRAATIDPMIAVRSE